MIPNKLKLNVKTQCDTQTDYRMGIILQTNCLNLREMEKKNEKEKIDFFLVHVTLEACLPVLI